MGIACEGPSLRLFLAIRLIRLDSLSTEDIELDGLVESSSSSSISTSVILLRFLFDTLLDEAVADE